MLDAGWAWFGAGGAALSHRFTRQNGGSARSKAALSRRAQNNFVEGARRDLGGLS